MYTYLIKCIPTNQYYYGVRVANKLYPEDDLWKKYFTSSKLVKKLIEKYGVDNFSYEIRQVFVDRDQARNWEKKVLRRMKVLSRKDIWLNRTVSKSIRYIIHPRLGIRMKQESKDKMSRTKLAKKIRWSEEKKLQKSLEMKGEKHFNYGKTYSSSLKLKLSESMKLAYKEGRAKMTPQIIAKIVDKQAKTYKLVSPGGEIVIVKNLTKFCKENNIHPPGLLQNGKSKGWLMLGKLD